MTYIGATMESRYGALYTVLLRASDFSWDAIEESLGTNAMFPRPINRMLDNE